MSYQRRSGRDEDLGAGASSHPTAVGRATLTQRHAAHGVSGPGHALPHLDAIQRSFGAHDISGVAAHVGGPAREASQAMGADGYATGIDVDLATADRCAIALSA